MRTTSGSSPSKTSAVDEFTAVGRGWIKFTLSEEAENEYVRGITGVIWSKVNDERIYRIRHAKSMGILRRLWFDGKRFEYCAGQDYTGEIRYIQNHI